MQDAIRAAALMCVAAAAQAATPDLPPTPAPAPAIEPARVVGWPDGARPKAPPGFRVAAFARGLAGPRSLAVLPNGDVLVAEAGARPAPPPGLAQAVEVSTGLGSGADRVTLLRDADRDGVAEQQFTLIDGLDRPSGILLRRDKLYVASADAVWSFSFLVGQTRVNAAPRRLFDLPPGGDGDLFTGSLATDPDESRLYVAAGSGRDPPRAAILSARWDGTDVGAFASLTDQLAGIAFEPVGGKLWTVARRRDLPGEGAVSGYLVEVPRGASAGVALGAQAAPLGLAFYRSRAFPARYHGGAFIGVSGSGESAPRPGPALVFVPFESGRPAGTAEPFLTGFIKDEDSREVYGRPAGVAVARDGALLVADDGGNIIWRIAPP
jgi:glucose/arabinose dehydrogenase